MNLTNALLIFIWASQVTHPFISGGAYLVGVAMMFATMGYYVDDRIKGRRW